MPPLCLLASSETGKYVGKPIIRHLVCRCLVSLRISVVFLVSNVCNSLVVAGKINDITCG